VVGLYLPMVVAAVGMARMWAFTIDDAYISYRYARNLSRGWGLVYNYGERIEGYTNFLWTVMLAPVEAAGGDVDLAAKVMGAAAALASVWLTYRLATRARPITWLPCLSTWVVASSMVFNGYSVFGLETAFFVALVLGGGVLFLRENDRNAPGYASGIVFGLAGLTRPEAPLYLGLWMLLLPGPRLGGKDEPVPLRFTDLRIERRVGMLAALCALAWLYIGYRRFGQPVLGTQIGLGLVALGLLLALVTQLPKHMFAKNNLIRGVVFVGIVGAHVAWRRSYYGTWLPNTLKAKTGDADLQIMGGIDYLTAFVTHESGTLFLALFGVAAALIWKRIELLYAAGVLLLVTAYVTIVGGDWMPLHRFFVPVVPFLGLLAGVGVRAAFERRDRMVSVALAAAVIGVTYQRWRAGEDDIALIFHKHHRLWRNTATKVAAWLVAREEKYGEAGRGKVALGDIGEVGYTTDFPIIDLLGLVDPFIAKLPGGYTGKTGYGYMDHVFAERPRYIVIICDDANCTHPAHPGTKVLYYNQRLKGEYAVSHKIEYGGWSWCIFERRTLIPK
jgi:hypothetical protein